MSKPQIVCPEHGKMNFSNTRYGRRYSCPTDGCTVVCWEGPTSTPADEETRGLRSECHELFDPLWRTGKMSRLDAYRLLSGIMNLHLKKTHIGMFTKYQCEQLLPWLKARQAAEAVA